MTFADDLSISGLRLLQPFNVLFRNDEEVCRRLWIDVFEGEDAIVLVNLFGGCFAADDAAEKAGTSDSMSARPKSDRDKFDKFTPRSRKVFSMAQEEAQGLQHNYIGTEHLLLGLVRENEGGVAKLLNNLGLDIDKARGTVQFIIGRGDRIVLGEIGLTPHAKQAIELAIDEAQGLNHEYIEPEHILLGIIDEAGGIAVGVLESLNVNLEQLRAETLQVLYPPQDS